MGIYELDAVLPGVLPELRNLRDRGNIDGRIILMRVLGALYECSEFVFWKSCQLSFYGVENASKIDKYRGINIVFLRLHLASWG